MSICLWPLGNGQKLTFTIYGPNTTWNDVAGLYIFAYATDETHWRALYVGQADKFSSRLPNHEKWDSALRLGATHIHALVVPLVANRVQLTTDGYKVYLDAVEDAFAGDIDYAMLIKTYESTQEETRYSPSKCTGSERRKINGNPDPKNISTSYIERQNLTMRMSIRRFTRLTNAFSKKIENHIYHLALHYMYYNFCRIHKTLRVTPAMEAGVTDRLWGIEDIVGLLNNH